MNKKSKLLETDNQTEKNFGLNSLNRSSRPTLAAFDVDGTLLTCNSSFAFCKYLVRKKVFSKFQLFFCAFYYFLHKGGIFSLKALQEKVFRGVFQGKSVKTFQLHIEHFLDELVHSALHLPAFQRLQSALQKGDVVALLSGSPRFLIEPLARRWNIPLVLGSEYTVDSAGCLWDIATIVDGKKKAEFLKKIESNFSSQPFIIAYTDNSLDLPFLEFADCAIAVRPNRALRVIARKKGWEILT